MTSHDPTHVRRELLHAALLGTAMGDALGLGAEGLPRRVTATMTWGRGPFFGRSLFSDDTEQSFLVAQALLASNGDPKRFGSALKWRLIAWFLALPPGVGLGTARSIIKLAMGFQRGIATAGNGAAMRSAVIGAAYYDDLDAVEALVVASTMLTHADERAVVGALAVAMAAGAHARGEGLDDVLKAVADRAASGPDAAGWASAVAKMESSLAAGDDVARYARAIGCENGITGYVYHTVPVALYAWARHTDPQRALVETWACGGDTDTVGAIVGALAYSKARETPPASWLATSADYPLTVSRLEEAGEALAVRGKPIRWAWFALPVRNLVVFPVILLYAIVFMLPRKWLGGRSQKN